MKNMKKFLTLFVVCILLLQIVPRIRTVLSDVGPIALYGVNIRPYKETNVSLVKENLEIKMVGNDEDEKSTDFSVNARFYLKNEGDETTVKTGFPFGLGRKYGGGVLMQAHNVSVKVNGKEITVHNIETETSIYDPWIYFDLHFAKGEEKVLDVDYEEVCPNGEFVYILETGGYWKGGKIGEFDMKIEFLYPPSPPFVTNISPGGYETEGSALVWQLSNFAPDKNVEITFIKPDFYKSIFPYEEKAEKSNSPEDWFEYALALMSSGNPFGPYVKNFLSDAAARNFEGYVETVFQKAISLQSRDSWRFNVLSALENVRFGGDSFMYGLGSGFFTGSYVPAINNAYFYLKRDLGNPNSAEEGKILAAFSEYMFLSDFSGDTAFNSVKDFNTFVNLAEKYAPNDPKLFLVSPVGNGDFFIREGENMNAPPFVECFIPKVATSKDYFELRYSLPPGAEWAASNLYSLMDAESMLKGVGVNCSIRQTLSGFSMRFAFKAKDEGDFKKALESTEKTIAGYAFDENGRIDSYGCALVNAYFKKIADNLEFAKDEGITFKNKEIDCSDKLESTSQSLEKEIEFMKGKESALKKLYLTELIYEPFLQYLEDSAKLLEAAEAEPKIKFSKEGAEKQGAKNKADVWEILFFSLLALCGVLFAFLIAFSMRLKKAVKK